MAKVLVITEKPKVAQKIAQVLGGKSVKSERRGRVTIYRFKRGEEEWVVVPASGHVLELDFPDSKREWTFPVIYPPEKLVFRPIRSKSPYLRVIREEGRDADMVIVATDLDTEGSAIGLEIVRYLGWEGDKEILRAEFSALTPEAIRRAFSDLKPFDYPRANAGWARRVLDLEWGANVTRALTLATREHSWVKVLSGGRVQSPALALIVKREEEIRNFVPRKYYVVTGVFETPRGETFEAIALPPRGQDRIWDRELAERIKEDVLGRFGLAKVAAREVKVAPPPPFNGTDMQVEVSRITGLTPRQIADRTTGIAQQLYEAGLISYIGTESQKYPKEWGRKEFEAMVRVIERWEPLREAARWVLENMRPRPVEGKKDDPAHPCIHVVDAPKGPGDLPTKRHARVYEIIARRVLATLSPDGRDRRTRIDVEVEGHPFRATGRVILEQGWRRVYPYSKAEERELPRVETGERLKCIDVRIEEKETQPPPRYTPRSLIREMERLGLGTKNTRAQILDILKERGYVEGKSFKPTPIGEAVIRALEKSVPEIVSPELTAQLDKAMQEIELGRLDHREFLESTLRRLEEIASEFEKRSLELGQSLAEAVRAHRRASREVGTCPKCGSPLVVRRSRYGRFVSCSAYPDCDVKYNLYPGEEVLTETCACGLPLVRGRIRTKSGKTLQYLRCLGNCDQTPLRCRECGAPAVPRKGRYGVFIACTQCEKVNYFVVRRRRPG